mmetsp:Transcript_3023/g.11690  ORF Transcript_3023/g.11690 Transcript_3023/m.11690 type:complete len:217 (-) Transcript_3023:1410-2060(-)
MKGAGPLTNRHAARGHWGSAERRILQMTLASGRSMVVLAAVYELLQRLGRGGGALVVVQIVAVAVQQRVAGHVEDVHEGHPYEAAEDPSDDRRRHRHRDVELRVLLDEDALTGHEVREGGATQHDQNDAEDREDECRTIQNRHSPAELCDHHEGVLRGLAEAVRGDGDVDVGGLIHELDRLLATIYAATEQAQHTSDDGVVDCVFVLLLRELDELL